MTPDRDKAARDLLAFYMESGVDAAVAEQPVDRFADLEPTRPAAAPKPAPPARAEALRRPSAMPAAAPAAPLSPDAAVMAAREAAKNAANLDELRAILAGFEGCGLKAHAKQLAFADGNPEGRVMFVGEAPGREEDIEGRPFVGRAGQLLDLMMNAIGLDRTNSYIANIVPWRPPGNRTPTPQETQICLPFTLRQIELADPDILVCLGNPSSQPGGIFWRSGRRCRRSPDGVKRNPGPRYPRMRCPRIPLRSMRATNFAHPTATASTTHRTPGRIP